MDAPPSVLFTSQPVLKIRYFSDQVPVSPQGWFVCSPVVVVYKSLKLLEVLLWNSSSLLSLLEGENKGIILVWYLSIKSNNPLSLILTLFILAVILGVRCSCVWEIGMTPKEIFPLLSLFWSCKWNYFLFSAIPSPALWGEHSSMWEMSCLDEVCRQQGVKQRCWTRRIPSPGVSPVLGLSSTCLGHAQCFWTLLS